jgi:hypothetical protein
VSLTSRWLVTVGSAPKPLLFIMVLHAKSFDFLHGPLKLPPALGTVLVYSVGPKEGLSG